MIRGLFFVPCFLGAFLLVAPTHGQSLEMSMEASLLGSVVIDIQSDFSVQSIEDDVGVITVSSDLEKVTQEAQPALIRIYGGASAALIDIESSNISIDGAVEKGAIRLYDFNIANRDVKGGIVIMPDSREDFFILAVGGKVEGLSREGFFTSLNIININYL